MLRHVLGMLLVMVVTTWPAHAGTPQGPAALDALEPAEKKDKAEEEQAMTDAEKEAAQKRKDKAARVLVLKWPDTEADHEDEVLRRNVRSRIDRPDGLFFPSVDLYQNGRRAPDRTLLPAQQPAMVPDQNMDVVRAEASRVSQIPWNAMAPAQWGIEGQKLLALVDSLWFIEKPEQREPLFLLYVQIGYCAENQNNPAPPFYEAIGGQFVNYYHYLAATLAYQDPSLMSKITDSELNGQVNFYLQQLQQGVYTKFPLDFELENQFTLDSFNKEYEVVINGLPVEVDDEARYFVPLGRSDIYMRRKDTGHGLSEILEVDKFEDKAYFVRDVARKKMGIEFIDQLFLHPNECTPELDGDILTYLAIYAKLHPVSEIYITVPRYGNPNKLWIWRYDRATATLQLVGGGNDGFPVRFAALASVGILYNGGALSVDPTISQSDINTVLDTTINSEITDRSSLELNASTLPVSVALRGHYNRLMIDYGMEFGYNLGEENNYYVDYYYTPLHKGPYSGDLVVVEEEEREEERVDDGGTPDEDDDIGLPDVVTGEEALHYTQWNRYIYWGAAVVLGRDASLGFGPRVGVRVGWTNVPRAVQPTLHVGYTLEAPIPGIKATNRVRPLIDVDARLGMSVATKDSLLGTYNQRAPDDISRVSPVFGLTGGVGTTF